MFGAYHKPLALFCQPSMAVDGVSDLLVSNRSASITAVLGGNIRTLVSDSAFRQITTILSQDITFINNGNWEIR
jgi:hypothetical protein